MEALLFALLTWLSSFHSPLEAKLPKVLCGWSRRLGCSPLAFHRRDHCKILTYFKINVSKKLASSARLFASCDQHIVSGGFTSANI